jgi:hypothetical protein
MKDRNLTQVMGKRRVIAGGGGERMVNMVHVVSIHVRIWNIETC